MALSPMSGFQWDDPFRGLRRVQDEMNRAFNVHRGLAQGDYPLVNVWTSEEGVAVTALVPGVSPGDMDITVLKDTLTLKGKREPELDTKDERYHRREQRYGSFTRSIALPFEIESDRVEASVKDGILTVRMPRAEADKPRRIDVAKT